MTGKFRTRLFLSWIAMVAVAIALLIVTGTMPWYPVGILGAIGFFACLVITGILIVKSGLGKYFGG